MMPAYIERSLEPVLRQAAAEFPAVVLTGPRGDASPTSANGSSRPRKSISPMSARGSHVKLNHCNDNREMGSKTGTVQPIRIDDKTAYVREPGLTPQPDPEKALYRIWLYGVRQWGIDAAD